MPRKQYIVFKINEVEYGACINNIQEIIVYEEPTSIPTSNKNIEGVINYRQEIVPAINIRSVFNVEKTPATKNTKIIIINLDDRNVGFIVDEIHKIINIEDENIKPAPNSKGYITGLAITDDNEKVLAILDLKLLNK